MAYVTPFFLLPARSVLLGMMHPETDPIFSSYILGTAADWQDLVWRTHIHEKLIPIAVLSVVHAVRISHGTRMLSGGIHGRLGLFQSIVLNLIVLFGSSCLLSLLLGMPSPLLMSPFAIALYTSVHTILYVSGLGTFFVQLHSKPSLARCFDLVLACIDAVCRTEGIVNLGLVQVQRHANPVIASSWFVQILAGALVSGGMPLIAATFHLHSPMGLWQMGTPAWVQQPSRLLHADLIGGAVASLLLLVLTSGHLDAKVPWIPRPSPTLVQWLSLRHKPDMHRVTHLPYLSLREAKALGTLTLFLCLTLPILFRPAVQKEAKKAKE